jgi:transposase
LRTTIARESDSVLRVSENANQPPTDIAMLQARLATVLAERDAAIAERDQALAQNHRLQHLLHQLQRMQFGRRSEKLDADQLALAFEDVEQAVAATEAADDKKDPAAAKVRADKRRTNRGALPAHLPRVHVTIAPEDTNCPCCRSPMHAIGEDTAERLDVIPAQFRVIVTHRPKYACRACEEAVVQAPAPERLIKGGLPTEAMVASVLVAKYAWHLPLYRQAQMLAAQGLDIKRSILAFWVGYAAAELKPIYLRLRELILTSAKIAVDETVAPVLDPGRGCTKKGYFWAIARDDRPWGGTDPPAIAYSYAPSATATRPTKPSPTKPPARRSRSPSAGRTCGVTSSTSPRAATRRSRAKRSSASLLFTRSRRRSAACAPTNAVPCARTRASRWCWRSRLGWNISSHASRAKR